MAECGKRSGGFFLELSSLLCPMGRKRKANLFICGFLSAFVACTIYVAFCPSPDLGSSWLVSFFASTAETTRKGGGLGANQNSGALGYPPTVVNTTKGGVLGWNQTSGAGGYPPTAVNTTKKGVLGRNQTSGAGGYPPTAVNTTKKGVLWRNQTSGAVGYPPTAVNTTKGGVLGRNQTSEGKNQTGGAVGSQKGGALAKNLTNMEVGSRGNGIQVKNQTVVGVGSMGNGTMGGPSQLVGHGGGGRNGSREGYWSVEGLKGCDLFVGRWVKDESYPLYKEGSCPHIDESLNCFLNGRPDREYQKFRWQPDGCNIPRLNATDMLERLRGKRLVFVGDSLNRNMWESLVCMLRNSIKDKTKVFEASGLHEFKTGGAYSFIFKDYGCSIEFFQSHFLVQEWEMPDANGTKKETLRLDLFDKSSSRYKDVDIIVFNTGHWWTHEKTSKGKDYYQEGNHVYSELKVIEAYHKALKTWARWVDANVDPKKTMVFFRGFSATHFRGGQWNSGGQCDHETEPITNDKFLHRYPPKMDILESVLMEMKTHVSYMNITRMSDYRKDAHPSNYRKPNLTAEERKAPDQVQDCSHWCLPGVPDSWNELLYAKLIIRQHKLQ